MSPQDFLAHFHEIANAPGGVARLRELMRTLAVQGALVEQNPAEGSAQALIEEIQAEKLRLISEAVIKRQNLDSITDADRLFAIPATWTWTRLGEIGDWGSGSTPPRDNSAFYRGDLPWLKSGELNDNQALSESGESVTELALKSCSFRLNQPGDILLAMYGATIGKAAILAAPAVTNQAVCGCTPFKGIFNRYLFNYLVAQRSRFQAASEGGAQPNISKVKIVNFPFPLPPLAEQKRIVAKVEELMALCDALEAQQQERARLLPRLSRATHTRLTDSPTQPHLDFLFTDLASISPEDMRRTILSSAVQGRLTKHDPRDGSVESTWPLLASRALKAKNDLYPGHWIQVKLGQIGEWKGGGTPSKSVMEYWSGSMPWVSPKDMKVLRISDAEDHISEAAIEGSAVQLIPANSLLMVVRGMILGRAFPVALTTREVTINQDMKALLPHVPDTAEFLLFVLRAFEPVVLASIERSSHGTCKLLTEVLHSFPIPIPPLAEQRRIVAKVDELMALVDTLEAQQQEKSRLAEAFAAACAASLSSPQVTG